MKTVLICGYGHILAHVARPLKVAQELRAMGHRVLFAGDGNHLDFARRAGFDVFPLVELEPGVFLKAARQPIPMLGLWTPERVERFVRGELALMRELKPDLVIGDLRLTTAISVRAAGLPYANLMNAYTTKYSAIRVPIFPRPINPIGGAIRSRLLIRPFNLVRRRYGLPPMKHWLELWEGDMTLLADVPEYAPLKRQPENFHYVGPIIWEPEVRLPDWVSELNPHRPVIYFTLGSSGHRFLFRRLVDSLNGLGYQVIITTGGQVDPADLSGLPADFHVADFLPGSKIIERSDAVVFHGGNGTAYQALASGVPVISIPTHVEQRWNANRLVSLGIGLKLNKLEAGPLREAISEVLENPRYRANAMRFKAILANYHGPKTAAHLIDKHLSGCVDS